MKESKRIKLTNNGVFDYERDLELHLKAQMLFNQLANFFNRTSDIDDEEIQNLNQKSSGMVNHFDQYQMVFRNRIAKMRERLEALPPNE